MAVLPLCVVPPVLPRVAVVMGSDSDLPTMEPAAAILRELGVEVEVRVLSAHRTPLEMVNFAQAARDQGFGVIVAGAGDDHPKPLIASRLSEVHHLQGGAMGREHPNLHLHPQLAQDGGGGFHGGQVRVTAHHNGNTGEHWRHNAEGQDCHRLPPWLQKPVLR